ncbi:MAG: ribonuclease HII [Pseudomonadota bacterium]
MKQVSLGLLPATHDGWIAGVDEAGRGPLAGPVVVAAVVLDPAHVPVGLQDSKRLSASRREALAHTIRGQALAYRIEIRDAQAVDAENILACTLGAMAAAVENLGLVPAEVRVDGNQLPPAERRIAAHWVPLVSGDARDASIAAASILAKTTRDDMMIAYDSQWPDYGFASHKGYGTKAHMAALARLGPCPIHRTSFAPVRRAIREPESV